MIPSCNNSDCPLKLNCWTYQKPETRNSKKYEYYQIGTLSMGTNTITGVFDIQLETMPKRYKCAYFREFPSGEKW